MVVKSVRALVAAILIIAGPGGVQIAIADQSQIDPQALAVAQSYFDALQAGNAQKLLSLFAGRERLRNETQLKDPTYPQFLADRYSSANLEVLDGGVRSGVSYIDIKIWINNNESVKERLILKPSDDPADSTLHIVARKELEQ